METAYAPMLFYWWTIFKKHKKHMCPIYIFTNWKSFLETLSRLSSVTFNIVANGYSLEIFIEGPLNNVNDYEYVTS